MASSAPPARLTNLPHATSSTSSVTSLGLTVLSVHEIIRSIFLFLDFQTIDIFLASIFIDSSLHGCFHDQCLWKQLLILHFGGELRNNSPHPRKIRNCIRRSWPWTHNVIACPELQVFLQSGDDRERFDKAVTIIQGDLGRTTTINGNLPDGIAFPTNSFLTNHYVGAAGAVFRRAGKGLHQLVNSPEMFCQRRETSEVVVTPGFDAGVRRLIHCVGPRITQPDCYLLLYRTYENMLKAVLSEQLQHVMVGSISTGSMGMPVYEGAQIALRVMQQFIRGTQWEGSLAVVCFDDKAFKAFSEQKKKMLQGFNLVARFPQQGKARSRR